jgi:hypothetical protein
MEGNLMSEADAVIPEPDEPASPILEADKVDERELYAKRLNVLVVLIALGTLGGFLFVIYKAIDSMKTAAEEAEGFFGLFAPPRSKAPRKTRAKPRRTGSSGSSRRPSVSRSRSVGLLARSLNAPTTSSKRRG